MPLTQAQAQQCHAQQGWSYVRRMAQEWAEREKARKRRGNNAEQAL